MCDGVKTRQPLTTEGRYHLAFAALTNPSLPGNLSMQHTIWLWNTTAWGSRL